MTTTTTTTTTTTEPSPVLLSVHLDETVDELVAREEVSRRYGIEEISSAAAARLALIFSSAQRPTLGVFAAGTPSDLNRILDDIFDARQSADTLRDARALDMLATYVIDAARDPRA